MTLRCLLLIDNLLSWLEQLIHGLRLEGFILGFTILRALLLRVPLVRVLWLKLGIMLGKVLLMIMTLITFLGLVVSLRVNLVMIFVGVLIWMSFVIILIILVLILESILSLTNLIDILISTNIRSSILFPAVWVTISFRTLTSQGKYVLISIEPLLSLPVVLVARLYLDLCNASCAFLSNIIISSASVMGTYVALASPVLPWMKILFKVVVRVRALIGTQLCQ
jgi:hypothetical protein